MGLPPLPFDSPRKSIIYPCSPSTYTYHSACIQWRVSLGRNWRNEGRVGQAVFYPHLICVACPFSTSKEAMEVASDYHSKNTVYWFTSAPIPLTLWWLEKYHGPWVNTFLWFLISTSVFKGTYKHSNTAGDIAAETFINMHPRPVWD